MAEETTIHNGNPYDLVDHPDQVENNETNQNETVENNDTKESGQFLKKIVKLIAKKFGLPDPETGEPFKKATEGQLETENKGQTPNNIETTLEQDVVAQEEGKAQNEQVKQEQGEKKNFSFENVMLGVSSVLDKIEKKVENKTLIDFDVKKVEENQSNETDNNGSTDTEITETEQQVQTTNEPVESSEINENPVEKNNEEYLSENH